MKNLCRTHLLMSLATVCLLLCSCGSGLPIGLIHTDVTVPISVSDDPEIKDYNVGRATCAKVLGLWTVGNAGLKEARENGVAGPISKIQRVEYEVYDWFGCGTFSIVVYGEKKGTSK